VDSEQLEHLGQPEELSEAQQGLVGRAAGLGAEFKRRRLTHLRMHTQLIHAVTQ
jgi:hypothetical protein